MQFSLVFSILVSFVALAAAYPALNVGTRACDFGHGTGDTVTTGEWGFCYDSDNVHQTDELDSNSHDGEHFAETEKREELGSGLFRYGNTETETSEE